MLYVHFSITKLPPIWFVPFLVPARWKRSLSTDNKYYGNIIHNRSLSESFSVIQSFWPTQLFRENFSWSHTSNINTRFIHICCKSISQCICIENEETTFTTETHTLNQVMWCNISIIKAVNDLSLSRVLMKNLHGSCSWSQICKENIQRKSI